MPVFHYRALDKEGAVVLGLVKADSRHDAEQKIRSHHLEVVEVEQKLAPSHRLASKISPFINRNELKSEFFHQLATLLQGGIPIMKAVQTIAKNHQSDFQQLALSIYHDMKKGDSFSKACSKHRRFFTDIETELIHAAEESQTLEQIFLELAEEKQKELQLRHYLRSAALYPVLIVFGFCLLLYIIISLQNGALATSFFGNWLGSYTFYFIIPLTLLVIALYLIIGQLETGRRGMSWLKLHIPVYGTVHRDITLAKISRVLAILIRNHVPIVKAIKLTIDATKDELFRATIRKASDKVEKGKPLSASLEVYTKMFPPIFINMLEAGEESGNLEHMARLLSDHFEKKAESAVKSLALSLEIFIIGLMAFGAIVLILLKI